MLVRCPGCTSLLEPTSDSCQVCLRKRTRQEIFRDIRLAKEAEERIKSRPKRIAVNVLVLAALAGGAGYAWVHYPKEIQALIKDATQRFSPPPPPPAPAPAPQAAAAVPAPSVPPAASAAPAASPAEALPRLLPPAKDQLSHEDFSWKIKGNVYDLFSLKGVPGAFVTFTDKVSGRKRTVKTNAKGDYSAKLDPLEDGGYEVTVSRKGYVPNYLDEMDPPYRVQTPARRQDAVELINVLHVPVQVPKNQDALEHNLILIPADQ